VPLAAVSSLSVELVTWPCFTVLVPSLTLRAALSEYFLSLPAGSSAPAAAAARYAWETHGLPRAHKSPRDAVHAQLRNLCGAGVEMALRRDKHDGGEVFYRRRGVRACTPPLRSPCSSLSRESTGDAIEFAEPALALCAASALGDAVRARPRGAEAAGGVLAAANPCGSRGSEGGVSPASLQGPPPLSQR
jgi:hypothetical protein